MVEWNCLFVALMGKGKATKGETFKESRAVGIMHMEFHETK